MRVMYGLLAATLCSLVAATESRADDCTSNLMIVIDRSCSMTSNSIMGKTRWDIAVDAINKLMTDYKGKLRFGLAMFPTKGTVTPMCVQAAPLLAPVLNNEQNVTAQLTANRPGAPCVTNIDEGVKQASVEPSLFTPDRRSFILLITDGEQSNNCNGGTATADPLTIKYITEMYQKKVPTYVVGFDIGSNNAAQRSLNSFAMAGGLAKMGGTTSYYPANNQAELESTLAALASLTGGGEFGVCRGMPCPDGRCLSATATCMAGYCVDSPPDMASDPNNPGGGIDDGGGLATGCGCEVGGRTASSAAGVSALGLLIGMLAWSRRRVRRRSAS